MTSLLFVYGTLRADALHPMGAWLERRAVHYYGKGWFRGRLYDLGRYPGAIPSLRAGARVVGELYRLRRAADLRFLDRYEGAEYRRRRAVVNVAGRARACWIYLYVRPVPFKKTIASGDWLKRE